MALVAGTPRFGTGQVASGVLGNGEVTEEVRGGGVRLHRLIDTQAQSLVDELPAGEVGPVHQGDRNALGAGASGTSDPVHVGLLVVRALVVDDVRDAGDVDSAGRHVGGHQDLRPPLAEPLESPFPSHLVEVTVNGTGREPPVGEIVGQTLAGPLGAAEDDRLLDLGGLQQSRDDLDLVERMRLVDVLGGLWHRRLGVGPLRPDVHRMVELGAGQGHDRCRHGGREQHRLATGGAVAEQFLHVGKETEIQHLVGLVQHDDRAAGEVEIPATDEVQQAARGADDDVDPALQRVDLGVVTDATVDGEHPGATHASRRVDVTGDLEGELTRGAHHQGLGQTAARPRPALVTGQDDALQGRHAECQCLARAGASLADEIGAADGDGDAHRLNGEGRGDTGVFQPLTDVGSDPQVGECLVF